MKPDCVAEPADDGAGEVWRYRKDDSAGGEDRKTGFIWRDQANICAGMAEIERQF